MTIQIQKEGRRYYLLGNTFPIKDRIKSAGCKWDPDRRAWYSGKKETAEGLAAAVESVPEPQREEQTGEERRAAMRRVRWFRRLGGRPGRRNDEALPLLRYSVVAASKRKRGRRVLRALRRPLNTPA